nr:immunoglobulin light chain junction region [Macaca mulatta]
DYYCSSWDSSLSVVFF